MTNISSYPTPDELDRMLDDLDLSPQTEAWIVGAIMDYRIAARTVMSMMKEREEHHHHEPV